MPAPGAGVSLGPPSVLPAHNKNLEAAGAKAKFFAEMKILLKIFEKNFKGPIRARTCRHSRDSLYRCVPTIYSLDSLGVRTSKILTVPKFLASLRPTAKARRASASCICSGGLYRYVPTSHSLHSLGVRAGPVNRPVGASVNRARASPHSPSTT